MKAKGFSSVVLLVAFSASPICAMAQSSVSLYGIVDEGIDYVSNSGGHALWRMRDGTYDGVFGSRWGVKGREDLGGGLSAIFQLESGFSLENGELRQGGRMFGRQAVIGLSDDKLGTLTLGRQYDSVVDYLQPVTAPGTLGGPLVHAGDIDNTDNSFRVDNSVKYQSPTFAGLQFGGLYSFSNTNEAGRGTTGLWSLGATYTNNGLHIAGAYLYAKEPALLLSDGNYVSNTTGSAVGAAGPFSYVGNPSNEQIFGAGVTYTLKQLLVGVDYSNTKFDNANGSTATVKFENYEIFGQYNITPSLTAGIAYDYTHGRVGYSGAVPIYHQIGFMSSLSLSKRTALYATGVYQKVAGGASTADIFDGAVASASSNDHQLALRVGMYHRF
ncbi:Outer membrane protein porin [Paraburkholderia caribensis MBA4]|uniref:Outer membrane protein porin n=1 Tax=Paraburkholderia caribensis MBA4 TaxID=1323664 RepID=A0A0P0RIB6_9BURK|nr:porin [Paraburkholderia caribensis]ALL68472.1 Outer membrane protein porin [Paraburkholderia caribensis MBA4]